MTDSKNDAVDLESVPEALPSAPPSWEEVMEEKKSKMQTGQVEKPSITNNDKNSKSSNDLLKMEGNQINEAKEINSINVANDDIKVLTATERLIEALNKVICFLKAVSRWSTTISDLILWISSVAVLCIGCLAISQRLEITKVFHHDKFRMISQALVVISCLNLAVFCPLGILGTWKNKRALLKLHNIWIFMNILVYLTLLFICYKFLHKTKDRQQTEFNDQFKLIYTDCYVTPDDTEPDQCCCNHINNETIQTCWQYEPNPKHPKDKTTVRREKDYKSFCESDKRDYFNRAMAAINNGFFYLSLFTAVEIPALGFALIQSQLLKSNESDAKKRKKRRKPPKGKVRKIYLKGRHMVCRRVLLVLFAILFYIGFVLCKLWYKGFKIKVGIVELNVIDIFWDQLKKLLSVSDEINDRTPN